MRHQGGQCNLGPTPRLLQCNGLFYCIERCKLRQLHHPSMSLSSAGQRALSLASHPGSWAVVPAFGQQKGGSGAAAGGVSSGAAGEVQCGAVHHTFCKQTVLNCFLQLVLSVSCTKQS